MSWEGGGLGLPHGNFCQRWGGNYLVTQVVISTTAREEILIFLGEISFKTR